MMKPAAGKWTIKPVTSTRIATNGVLDVAGANPARFNNTAVSRSQHGNLVADVERRTPGGGETGWVPGSPSRQALQAI